MTPEDIKALLARWTDAWIRRDVGGLMALYADDCAVVSPTYGTLMGHEAVEKYHASNLAIVS